MKVLIIMMFVVIFLLIYEVVRLRKDLDRFKQSQRRCNHFTDYEIRRLYEFRDIVYDKLKDKK